MAVILRLLPLTSAGDSPMYSHAVFSIVHLCNTFKSMKPSLSLMLLVADAGIPMIALTLPLMVIVLIPTILIEGFLCKKWLGLTTWHAIKLNAVSNAVSTIIGIPLAWIAMLGVEFGAAGFSGQVQNWHSPIADVIFFLLGSAWIGPAEGKSIWMIPAATLVLLIPFFFASYGIEYLVIRTLVGMPEGGPPNLAYPRVQMAVRNANLVTYGIMFVVTSVWLIIWLPR